MLKSVYISNKVILFIFLYLALRLYMQSLEVENRQVFMLTIPKLLSLCLILTLPFGLYAQTEWRKYSDNPVLDVGPPGSWDDWWVGPGFVLRDGTTYQMWYDGSSNNTDGHLLTGQAVVIITRLTTFRNFFPSNHDCRWNCFYQNKGA